MAAYKLAAILVLGEVFEEGSFFNGGGWSCHHQLHSLKATGSVARPFRRAIELDPTSGGGRPKLQTITTGMTGLFSPIGTAAVYSSDFALLAVHVWLIHGRVTQSRTNSLSDNPEV